MSKSKQLRQTLDIIDRWIADLDQYTFEQISQVPEPGSWSIGQVYIHLWMSSKGFFFRNVERCAGRGEKSQTGGRKNWAGTLVFVFRLFPPVKVKMPGEVAVQPNPPESKEQLIRRMQDIKDLALKAAELAEQADPSVKVKHPFLGWLNASEWFNLCGFHFRHHEAQIGRIRKTLGF